jgi:hypothetical protein
VTNAAAIKGLPPYSDATGQAASRSGNERRGQKDSEDEANSTKLRLRGEGVMQDQKLSHYPIYCGSWPNCYTKLSRGFYTNQDLLYPHRAFQANRIQTIQCCEAIQAPSRDLPWRKNYPRSIVYRARPCGMGG